MFPHWPDTRAATYHYNDNYMVWLTVQSDVQVHDSHVIEVWYNWDNIHPSKATICCSKLYYAINEHTKQILVRREDITDYLLFLHYITL